METSFTSLLESRSSLIRIACDTEFEGPHTVTAQFAARIGEEIAVQVYHAADVPPPVNDRLLAQLPHRDRQPPVLLREPKLLTPDLSPVRLIRDLFELPGLQRVDRQEINGPLLQTETLSRPLTLVLVGHFWTADFFRIFGADFLAGLIQYQHGHPRLAIKAEKLLGFREKSRSFQRFHDPVLEYVRDGGTLHAVCVRHFDTCLPFGRGSLDDLAQTFLGLRKSEGITRAEKACMRRTFQRKPDLAYAYAVHDSLLTLQVEERMRAEDRHMYVQLGVPEADIPPLRPTLGSRVAETIVKAMARQAAGSVELSQRGRPRKNGQAGKASLAKVKRLLAKGGAEGLATAKSGSMFGQQTGETHGGLLFSRSPTQFFHNAPGQFRDVDLSGCYAAILGGMALYAGRPCIHEPGSARLRLREAVALTQQHAAGRDAWIIKVSGPITAAPNVLIPSTKGALTNANYQSRAARQRARSRRQGFAFDWLFESRKATGSAAIYTDVVEAGIVAWPTWLMIQAMPPALRQQYENLEVDSLIFYPAKLVAGSGLEYDRLVGQMRCGQAPWAADIDLDAMQQTITRQLDEDHVTLRFDIGGLARQIADFRCQARAGHGRGSGAELAWKQHANANYGVLASRYLPTNNVVAANVITATARALAFAMQLALNGVQVITDGCTYRRDQIPTGTFAECLAANPEYPIRRVEAGVPFQDPQEIPTEDREFTGWYRQHVKTFFGLEGEDADRLLDLHALEHKATGSPPAVSFDGLCCDGSGNYLKLHQIDQEWRVADFKARSFRAEAKAELSPWILATYVGDRYVGPPPITTSPSLLTYKEAGRLAQKALRQLAENSATPAEVDTLRVWYPLGLELRRPQAYKVLKPSAFLFRTPAQQAKFVKAMAKFADRCGCGLEVLALRRGTQQRPQGSIRAVAEAVYRLIREGEANPTRALNLTRDFRNLKRIRQAHMAKLQRQKAVAERELFLRIDCRNLQEPPCLTGLFVGQKEAILLE